MGQPIWVALVGAILVALSAAKLSAAPSVVGQQQAAQAFAQVCLGSMAEPSAVRQAAVRLGMKKTDINGTPAKIIVKPSRLQGHRDFSMIRVELE